MAMWWAVVTLGTIGYGDVIPITRLARRRDLLDFSRRRDDRIAGRNHRKRLFR